MNLTKHDTTSVDILGKWYGDNLFITLLRTEDGRDVGNFHITLDDIDLEHFISTLIEFQR